MQFETIIVLSGLVWVSFSTFDELKAASSPSAQLTSNSQQQQAPTKAPGVQSSREIEKQIVDKILGEGYDKRIRPAGTFILNASKPGGGM